MPYQRTQYLIILLFIASLAPSCNRGSTSKVKEKEIVKDTSEINAVVESNLEDILDFATDNNGKVGNEFSLPFFKLVNTFYESTGYKPVWSDKVKWDPLSDSLMEYSAPELESVL